jgi:hypothetical protein
MKRLLTLTAIIEAATGLGLVAVPSVVVRLLLGAVFPAQASPSAAWPGWRCFALGVACWLASYDRRAARRGIDQRDGAV